MQSRHGGSEAQAQPAAGRTAGAVTHAHEGPQRGLAIRQIAIESEQLDEEKLARPQEVSAARR